MALRTGVTIQETAISYPILVGAGLLEECGQQIRAVLQGARTAMIVTDVNVAPHYLATVKQSLEQAGLSVFSEIIPAGEAFKTLATLERLYDSALEHSLKRRDVIVALGGGIIGDLTGYLAATFQRGVPFVQVPTTLLAQVDASVGGKVAINWRHFKNLVGAFYHPKTVIIDTLTLKTLPPREFACGMAEVIKYSFLEASVPGEAASPSLFSVLQQAHSAEALPIEDVITRCCRLKAAVVEADPQETLGIREILNLGHTFGHAYETLSQGDIPHGEAVAIGMVKAFRLAETLGQMPADVIPQVKALLQKFSLPVESAEGFAPDEVLQVMLQDKKTVVRGTLRLVLPYEALGKVRVQEDVPQDLVRSIL